MIDKTPAVRVGMFDTPLNKLRKAPREVVTVRIKNRGPNPRIIFDTSQRAIKLAVGEAKAIEIGKKYAQRIQALSLQGGSLTVLDQSVLDGDADAKPVQRVRIKSRGEHNAEHAAQDQRTSKRAPKTKAKHGSVSKSSGKPAKAPKDSSVIRPEIKTASELLNAMNDGEPLAYNHFKSVAFRVLPAGTLANGANKAAILKALEVHARAE
jgi:hypothetical protein